MRPRRRPRSSSNSRDVLVLLDSAAIRVRRFGKRADDANFFFRWAQQQPVALLAVPVVGAEFDILNLL